MQKGIRPFSDNVKRAKGKYIALCEGDDYWTDPLKLQKQVDFLEANENYSMCFHEAELVNENGEFIDFFNKISSEKTFDIYDLIKQNFISTASCVFRVFEHLPEWLNKAPVGDWGLHILNAEKGKIYYMPDCMSAYRIHSEGMWSKLNHNDMINNGIEIMTFLDKAFNKKYHSYFKDAIKKRKKRLQPKSILKPMDNFTQIPFSIDNLDRYYIRKSIFKALKDNLTFFSGKLLDYGCGKMPYKKYILENSKITKYIGLDIETAIDYKGEKPDFTWDCKKMPFKDNEFDTIFATEVFEHIHDLDFALIEIYRVLKKGGSLFFTVPYIWTLHETPNDEYRYTPFALEKKFKKAGFSEINIFATGGWNASLAQMLGLWVRRKPLSKKKRKFLVVPTEQCWYDYQ